MRHRSGVTLIEVLIAIFVSALGLISLLALFPLGALSMYRAIKDNRCAQACSNGQSIAAYQRLPQDPALSAPLFLSFPYGTDAFTNPSVYIPGTANQIPNLATFLYPPTVQFPNGIPYSGPGYPVYIDPIGAIIPQVNALGVEQFPNNPAAVPVNRAVVGYLPNMPPLSPGFLRLSPSFTQQQTYLQATGYTPTLAGPIPFPTAPSSLQVLRNFSLEDDLTFLNTGLPGATNVSLERAEKFTWAYLLRRPNFANPNTVEVTVVAYSDRSTLTLGENSYYVDFIQGTNNVTIYLNQPFQEKPHIKAGGWILDATILNWVNGAAFPDPHGIFYRVTSVTDSAGMIGANVVPTLVLQLEKNIRLGTTPGTGQGVLVVLDNVAEVFERGPQ